MHHCSGTEGRCCACTLSEQRHSAPFWEMCHWVTRLRRPTAALSSLLTTSGHSASSADEVSSPSARSRWSSQAPLVCHTGSYTPMWLRCLPSAASGLIADPEPHTDSKGILCSPHICIAGCLFCPIIVCSCGSPQVYTTHLAPCLITHIDRNTADRQRTISDSFAPMPCQFALRSHTSVTI